MEKHDYFWNKYYRRILDRSMLKYTLWCTHTHTHAVEIRSYLLLSSEGPFLCVHHLVLQLLDLKGHTHTRSTFRSYLKREHCRVVEAAAS